MGLTVCIATYNTLALTQRCFDSLIAQTEGLIDEVIVVDDLSTDGTREYLQTLPAPFKCFYNDRNRGFAFNNNLAVRYAQSDIICLLNADTLLTPHWAQPMLKALASVESVGIVGNIHWNPNTRRYDHMGMYWTEDLIPKHFGKDWRIVPFHGVKQWPAVTAACCMVRKSVFEAIGGFDEQFVNGYEDTDLCLRLSQNGYRNFVACDSRIMHHVSSSPGRRDHEDRNRSRFQARWREVMLNQVTDRTAHLDGINYLGRYADRPWKYNGNKFLAAWRNTFKPHTIDSSPKLWPHG